MLGRARSRAAINSRERFLLRRGCRRAGTGREEKQFDTVSFFVAVPHERKAIAQTGRSFRAMRARARATLETDVSAAEISRVSPISIFPNRVYFHLRAPHTARGSNV